MTIQEMMERAGINRTGQAIAYIKEALYEIATISPTHTKTMRLDISEDKRFYEIPKDVAKLLDVRCKDHDNETSTYQTIPRAVYEPGIEDTDGV